jgi:tetratricopeptide (TPR) repeat protein
VPASLASTRYHTTILTFIDQHREDTEAGIGGSRRAQTIVAWPGLFAEAPPRPRTRTRADTTQVDSTPAAAPFSTPGQSASALPERQDVDILVESYLDRAEVALDEDERAGVLRELARLLEHSLGDIGQAFAVRAFAYRTLPERVEWDDLERLAARAEQWDELAAAYEDAMPLLPAMDRADAWWRLARLYHQRLGSVPRALECAAEALALEPGHRDAGKLQLDLLRKSARWEDLARVLAERAPAAGLEERTALRRELAQIYEHHLDDVRGAIDQYQALQSELPGDLGVLRALDRLYARAGLVRAQLDVLSEQAGLLEDVRALAVVYQRMATLWDENLGDPARAADCIEWALALGHPSDELQRELRRLYRASKRWPAAVDACRRQAEGSRPEERADLLIEAAEILAEELGDAHQALALYREAEQVATSPAALWPRITELCEATGDVAGAVELLVQRAEHERDATARSEHYARAGELATDQLRAPETAERLFLKALQHRPAHAQVLGRLADIYRARGQAAAAVALIADAVVQVDDAVDRVRLLVQAGDLAEAAGLPARAVGFYRRALDEDPRNVTAATRAADLLWAAADHEALLPVLRQLVDSTRDPQVLRRAWTRLGYAAHAIGRHDEAAGALERARALGPADAASLQAHAASLFHLERWPAAADALERLLAEHADTLSVRERHEACYMLGMCRLRMDDTEAARAQWLEVLAEDAGHRATLQAIAGIETDRERLLEHKRTLAELSEGAERCALLRELGDLYRDAFADRDAALAAYRQALQIQPDSHRLLHRCLDLYAEAEDWDEALEILQRLIEVEQEPSVRARYRYTIATIHHEKQDRSQDALASLHQALADEPRLQHASRLVEDILTRAEDWGALRHFYYEQLQRLEKAGDAMRAECVRLWTRLGELCRDRFDDRAGAIASWQVAAHLQPDDPAHHATLAELHLAEGPASADQAIAELQIVLALDPRRVAAYSALEGLYRQTGHFRGVHACASARAMLVARGLCPPGETGKQAAPPPLPDSSRGPRRPLGAEHQARLRDPGEDGPVSRLMALLAPVLLAYQAGSREHLGLLPSHVVAESDDRPFARVFRRVVSLYGMDAPDLYANPSQPHPIAFASERTGGGVVRPALVLGKPALSPACAEDVLVFALGRHLAHLCRERLMRLLAPEPAQVLRLAQAAMALEHPNRADRSLAPPVARALRMLQQGLTPAVIDQVVAIAAELDERGLERALHAWMAAADHTALRMALTLQPGLDACAATLEFELAAADPGRRSTELLALARANVCQPMLDARAFIFR